MERRPHSGLLRIGELSRRVGVSDHVLRSWEIRYGLLEPTRSPGGFRLYSDSDERRVRRMRLYMAQGVSAAEAARAAIADVEHADASDPMLGPDLRRLDLPQLARSFQLALDDFDEGAAHAAFDRLLSDFSLTTTLRDVVLPYLHALGERWERGQVTIAQEHFASNVIRGRLTGLARGWGDGAGPRAVVACAPDELHDLPALIFGIVLHRSGWSIDYFGASTPVGELVRVADVVRPELVVVAATTTDRFSVITDELAQLAAVAPLAIAGAGATQHIADQVGARLLAGDPVTEAEIHGRRTSRRAASGASATAG